MSDFSDFAAQIRDYANRQDWADNVVLGFIRSAEEQFNQQLRVRRMIKTAVATIDHACVNLPDDWLEADFMAMQVTSSPTGWFPLRYKTRDLFFRQPNTSHSTLSLYDFNTTFGYYTMEGSTIFFGGPPDAVNGTAFRMDYFAEVPVFAADTPSWVYDKYPSMYRRAAMVDADLYAVGEEDKAGGLKMLVEDQIQKLNDEFRRSRASGSRLARGHTRSFG